jgi:hypothetical protein
VLSILTAFRGRRWNPLMLAGVPVCATLAVGLGAVSWGGTSLRIGLLVSGVALLVTLALVWLLRVGARGLTSA